MEAQTSPSKKLTIKNKDFHIEKGDVGGHYRNLTQ